MNSTIRIGVIGYGYWGPNIVRNFNTATGGRSQVVMVCDPRPEARARVLGLNELLPEAIKFKFMNQPMSEGQLADLVQIPK